jgi:hypothetical protein
MLELSMSVDDDHGIVHVFAHNPSLKTVHVKQMVPSTAAPHWSGTLNMRYPTRSVPAGTTQLIGIGEYVSHSPRRPPFRFTVVDSAGDHHVAREEQATARALTFDKQEAPPFKAAEPSSEMPEPKLTAPVPWSSVDTEPPTQPVDTGPAVEPLPVGEDEPEPTRPDFAAMPGDGNEDLEHTGQSLEDAGKSLEAAGEGAPRRRKGKR